jgi:hypothetical protein
LEKSREFSCSLSGRSFCNGASVTGFSVGHARDMPRLVSIK